MGRLLSAVALWQSRSRGMVLHSGPIVFRGITRHPLGRGLEMGALPRNWTILVNGELSAEELKTVRTSVSRGRPLGPEAWVEVIASRLGLAFTFRGPGRPRKALDNR
jgi:hypothetical protein